MGRGRKGQTEQSQRKLKVLRRLTQRKGATMDYFYVPNVIKKIVCTRRSCWNYETHESSTACQFSSIKRVKTSTGNASRSWSNIIIANMQIKWFFVQAWRTKIFYVWSHGNILTAASSFFASSIAWITSCVMCLTTFCQAGIESSLIMWQTTWNKTIIVFTYM